MNMLNDVAASLTQPLLAVVGIGTAVLALVCSALALKISRHGGERWFLWLTLACVAALLVSLAPWLVPVTGIRHPGPAQALLGLFILVGLLALLAYWLLQHWRQALTELTRARADLQRLHLDLQACTGSTITPGFMPESQLSRQMLMNLINDFRRAREEQADTEQFAESIIENLPLMLFVKSADDLRFRRINKAGEQLLGIAREDIIGKTDYDFFPPEQADHFTATDYRVLAGGTLENIPAESVNTPSGVRWLHTRKIPVKNSRGKPLYLLGISEDVTERLKFINELEQANLHKSRFLANMSHELRTPMNSIIGFTEKVLRSSQDRLTARELDALATVKRSAHHLLGLINDILDLSKIEAGKMEVEREEVDLRLFIELERTQYTQLAKSAGLDFHLHLPTTPLQLHTDRRRLLQILNNLISNAVKYTERGEVSVSVQQEIHADLGPVVAIHVQDTGLGIRPEDQQRLFREFGRAAEVRQKNIQGTGLGLLISAQLVALLGGRISVHSEHGKGSRFSVFFPMMGS